MQFTACYKKIESGYMGQLLEWPQVITEGKNLNECRELLIDAACEMAFVYKEDGLKIPQVSIMIEPLSIPVKPVEEAKIINVS